MADFQHPPLDDMVAVGLAGAHSARVWVRSATPGPHRLAVWPEGAGRARAREVAFEVPADPATDGTAVVDWARAGGGSLEPRTRYLFDVRQEARRVGEGRFETAPAEADAADDTFSFAVLSCHMPFDENGAPSAQALRLLAALEPALEERNVKRVLTIGDQMYSDMPDDLSLFESSHFADIAPQGRGDILECSAAEVRALYHRRYRIFWNSEPWQRLNARWSTLPMLDDHDIVDNWGSVADHREPRWWALRDGAREAYQDYQGSRVRGAPGETPPSFHYSFEYGPVACFVMDLRSQKETHEDRTNMYGEDQLEDLRRYLAEQADRPVVLIALSVPILHLPDWMVTVGEKLAGGEGSDPADRWSHARARESRERLLGVLHRHMRDHPHQRVAVAGGDVHVALATEMRWRDTTRPVFQLVSSPISNHQGDLWERVAGFTPKLGKVMGTDHDLWTEALLLEADQGSPGANPFGGLNAGIVTFRRRPDGSTAMRFEILSHDEDDPPGVRVVFRSPEL